MKIRKISVPSLFPSMYRTSMINACIGIGKLLIGIYYFSCWMVITASYYLTLGIIRRYILQVSTKENKKEYILYHKSGFLIIILSIVYLLLSIWMYFFNEQISYPPYILYGVAAIAFYKITVASIGIIRIKKQQLGLSNLLIINLFDACVSIVFIQCALLISQKSTYASSSSAILGVVISILFICIGLYMVYKKDKAAKTPYSLN